MDGWEKNLERSQGYPKSCHYDQEHEKEQEQNFK